MGSNIPKPITWIVNDNGCWECNSHPRDARGYPHIGRDHKVLKIARVVYQQLHGDIPNGMVLRHLCNNTCCINPTHLKPGTQKENEHDKKLNGTWQTGENNPFHKLSDEQVEIIRREYHPGVAGKPSTIVLARKYGVNKSTIQRIANGERRQFKTGEWEAKP